MGEELAHRSATQFTTYGDCSELYRIRYVDKPPEPISPAAWLAQGTAYHEATRAWEESGRSPLFDIGQAFNGFYDQEILKMREKEPDLNKWLRAPSKKTQVDIDERKEKGRLQAEAYVEYANLNPFIIKDIDEFTLGLEVPFEVTLSGILVKGQIDQILQHPNGVEVRDLKTGNRESANIQLGLYKVAVEKIFRWPVVKASFFYAKDSKLVTLRGSDLERYSEEYVSDLFVTLERGIKNKVFIPSPGSHCTLCPVKKYCREMGSK